LARISVFRIVVYHTGDARHNCRCLGLREICLIACSRMDTLRCKTGNHRDCDSGIVGTGQERSFKGWLTAIIGAAAIAAYLLGVNAIAILFAGAAVVTAFSKRKAFLAAGVIHFRAFTIIAAKNARAFRRQSAVQANDSLPDFFKNRGINLRRGLRTICLCQF